MNKNMLIGLLMLVVGIGIGYGLALAYPASISGRKTEYKNAYGTAEIPATWSTVSLGDVAPLTYSDFYWDEQRTVGAHPGIEKLQYSIAQGHISFGDWNATQIDMAIGQGEDLRRVVQTLKSQPAEYGETWTTETVDGKHADVLNIPLDNGQVTKGGTGGKVYFITWEDQGLYMHKQALGDEAFEKGFAHFLETLDLDY
jgi:hypothetical protein